MAGNCVDFGATELINRLAGAVAASIDMVPKAPRRFLSLYEWLYSDWTVSGNQKEKEKIKQLKKELKESIAEAKSNLKRPRPTVTNQENDYTRYLIK